MITIIVHYTLMYSKSMYNTSGNNNNPIRYFDTKSDEKYNIMVYKLINECNHDAPQVLGSIETQSPSNIHAKVHKAKSFVSRREKGPNKGHHQHDSIHLDCRAWLHRLKWFLSNRMMSIFVPKWKRKRRESNNLINMDWHYYVRENGPTKVLLYDLWWHELTPGWKSCLFSLL
jgi:hypothetical protein